jgi:replicative DNA helicase
MTKTLPQSPKSVSETTSKYLDLLQQRQNATQIVHPTGFCAFDEALYGGLREGSVYVIEARPAMGKTLFALTVALHVAASNTSSVLVCSPESSHTQIVERLIGCHGSIHSNRQRRAELTSEDMVDLAAAAAHVSELPIFT